VLNEFYAEHKDEGVAVLGISIDADPEEVIPPFLEENPIEYPVLLGDEALARRYGAPGFPALVVVDPDGRIVYVHVGLAEEEDLEAVLALIAEAPART
jgi:peroxiredoxin